VASEAPTVRFDTDLLVYALCFLEDGVIGLRQETVAG